MIDYYLEEERVLRAWADRENVDEKVLATKLDEMWGKVTLYNTYQLFVQLTAKKSKNPAVEFSQREKAGEFEELKATNPEAYKAMSEEIQHKSVLLWESKPEVDLLTLYFNATDALPMNSMRRLVSNANNALRAMAGAEKMMASVYGIAITAMVRRVCA